jgi:perosamine synthetase
MRVTFDKDDIRDIHLKLDEILSNGMLAQGKYVDELERQWAEYVGAKNAVAVSSGTSAIEAPMHLLGVAGKEVLVPDNTFAATAMSVMAAGGRVRFVDTDPSTFSVRLDDLKARLGPETVGVIVVHIGGIVTPEIRAIRRWCDDQGIWLFEDCAHAHGSEYGGKRAGTFGVAGSYSFFATKVMTSAEGGMIVTNDDAIAEQSRLMRNHGKPQPWVSYHTRIGSNWRMSELNAIVALAQLRRLDEFVAWREKIAKLYSQWLQELPEVVSVLPASRSSWYKYIVLLPGGVDRAAFKQRMKERGVSLSGEVYETPLHDQPVFRGLIDSRFPVADDVCRRHVCLPLYHGMTEDQARFVIYTFKSCLANSR